MWSRALSRAQDRMTDAVRRVQDVLRSGRLTLGDISAEPNGITDPISFDIFPRAHGKESEPVPSADDRYVESAREGD